MKKLVFVAFGALSMVLVSNVFAGASTNVSDVYASDTVVVEDTTVTEPDTTVVPPVKQEEPNHQ